MTALSIFTLCFIATLVVSQFRFKGWHTITLGASLVCGILVIILQQSLEVTGVGLWFYPVATVLVAVALILQLRGLKTSKTDAASAEKQTEKIAELEAKVETLEAEKKAISEELLEYRLLQKVYGADLFKK